MDITASGDINERDGKLMEGSIQRIKESKEESASKKSNKNQPGITSLNNLQIDTS